MRGSLLPAVLRLMVGLASVAVAVQGQTTNRITGEVLEDASWSGICLLEGTVIIAPDVTVAVDPGSTVLLGNGAVLEVRGRLEALGTAEGPIAFTRSASGTRWKQIRFVDSDPSVLHHCVFEYADSAGTHLDYYDNDCDPGTALPPRNYHEAIVVIASDLELEDCLFQNLPDGSGSGEGDALAVISDDPTVPGDATAVIRRCDFIGIGQGIHTRFSYVLVEDCYFTGHHGDNDDVDLYGESVPPPLIRHNLFLNPAHDDMINPTRCSAVIVGNVIGGGDDHGLVLRDIGAPIVMNNLIFDCASGGIAVQNQCDATLINNTIVNCGRGIRFFDHTGRWGPPYCLTPGSGRATVINGVIWDCPTTFSLEDSPFEGDRGSHLVISNSIVQGGQSRLSVSAHSTVAWGEGNLDLDPQLDSEHRPMPGSPAIDAGADPSTLGPAYAAWAGRDLDGRARPLDGTGDGQSLWDLGPYETLLANADSNQDGIPDGWCEEHGFNPLDPDVAAGDADDDRRTTFEEWVADTDPRDSASVFRIDSIRPGFPLEVICQTSSNRVYTLHWSPVPEAGAGWQAVPGMTDVPGSGKAEAFTDDAAGSDRFYQVQVRVP